MEKIRKTTGRPIRRNKLKLPFSMTENPYHYRKVTVAWRVKAALQPDNLSFDSEFKNLCFNRDSQRAAILISLFTITNVYLYWSERLIIDATLKLMKWLGRRRKSRHEISNMILTCKTIPTFTPINYTTWKGPTN